ncbi:CLUMA_CG020518, isoform A [Clunio marinus]|uniref:CLUMA_CG020518, isoform A n=1 Tax=Clunio marinus TaxID=568069 RepID=A0A1J1J972_9DIPT|nr:CLUMA_CG020518, isoform A [Clunio marinus]
MYAQWTKLSVLHRIQNVPHKMIQNLLKFLIFSLSVKGILSFTFEHEIELDELHNALLKVVEDSFVAVTLDIITCTHNNDIRSDIIGSLLEESQGSISYRIERCEELNDSIIRKYVLILMDHSKTDFMIKQLTPHRFDFSGFYLIHYVNFKATFDILNNLFRNLSDLFIHNVNVISNDSNVIQLKTFFYFTEKICNSTEPVVINRYENNQWKSKEFFLSKTKNFFGCPLKVATFIYEPAIIMEGSYDDNNYTLGGSEVEILKGVANVLNFSIQYNFDPTPGAWGRIKSNGEASGSYLKVIEKEVDLMIGSITKTYIRTFYVAFSTVVNFNDVLVVVPPGQPFTAFEKMIKPFEGIVWIVLLVILTVGFTIAVVLSRKPHSALNRIVVGKEIKMPAMSIIVALVGGSLHVLPKRSTPRVLLTSFLLFCLVIRTLYTAALFNFLQSDNRRPGLSSLKEVIDKKFPVYVYPSFYDNYKELRLLRRAKTFNSSIGEYYEKVHDANFEGVIPYFIDNIAYYNKNNYKKFVLRVLKERIFSVQSAWMFPKNSFLVEIFNEKLEAFKENGLLDFSIKKYVNPKYLNIKKTKSGPKKLNFENLWSFRLLDYDPN